MKRFKKITALLIALFMCFSMMAATLTAAGYFEGHISYNGNSNSGGTNPANTTFTLQVVNSVTDFWAKVSGPGSLTKTGYTFSGWNTNAAGTGTSYSVDQWVACQRTGIFHNYFNDLNLYAQWTINKYTVTFKTTTGGTINGGTSDVVVNNVNHGTTMTGILPTVTTDADYIFTGWTPTLPTTVTEAATYTANFTNDKYTVTFKTTTGGTINGGTSDVVVNNVNHGTTMTGILPTVTADAGYTFTGWTPTLPTTVTGAGTYTANFTLDKYTVTFKTTTGGTINGGTSDVVVSNVNHGTAMTGILPTVTANAGYTFTGWTPTLPTTVTGAGTYTASFTTHSYTIANPSSLTGVSFTASTTTTQYPKGTRSLVAASLLLAYYDTEKNSNILNGSYSTAVSAYSYLLGAAKFEANGGTYPYNDADAINKLLSIDLSISNFGAKAFWGSASTSSVISKLKNNEPVVLYLSNGSIVVAYAYSTVSQVTTFSVHKATKDTQGNAELGTANANEVKSILWLNTVSNHTHSMRYTGSDSSKHYQKCTNPNCAVHNSNNHNFTCTYSNGQHVMTCSCGFIYTFVDHKLTLANCTQPATCTICGTTVGSPLGHNYAAAICTQPQTCTRCGTTVGSALGHDYSIYQCHIFVGLSGYHTDGHMRKCSRCGVLNEATLEPHTFVYEHWDRKYICCCGWEYPSYTVTLDEPFYLQ